MPSPFARVVWNKFEAALLVDTYEKVAKGELLRKAAIAKLSRRLRYRKIMNEPTLKSKACLKCLYFTKIISALCCYLEYFSYLYTIN